MEEGQVEIVPKCSAQREFVKAHELLECYNITEDDKEKEDPRNVHISEIEWENNIVGLALEYYAYTNPLRV
jgi:hypothetical protein